MPGSDSCFWYLIIPADAQPTIASTNESQAAIRAGWRGWLLPLALCVLAIAALRLHTYSEPLERDITWYAVLGHEMLAGRSFYSDLWFHKPPGAKVAFAMAELVAGYGPRSVYLLNIVSAVFVLIGVYFAAARLGDESNRRTAALWAGIFWVLLSGEPNFQANQPNTEVFMNACGVLALVLLLRGTVRPLTWLETLLIGALAAISSLFKQVGIVPILLPAAVYAVFPPDGSTGRRRGIVQVAAMNGVIAAAWGGMLAYYALRGHWTDAYEALFVYNAYYAQLSREPIQPIYFVPLIVLLLPAALAWYVRADLTTAQLRAWAFYTAGTLGAFLAVLLPGRFFGHYFQLLLPWAAIAAGGLATLIPSVIYSERRGMEHLVIAILALPLILYEGSFYLDDPAEWSRYKYGPAERQRQPEFVLTYKLADELNKLLEPGETFYDFGHSTGLYFASGRKPPSGMLFADPLTEGPLQRKLSTRVQAELEQTKPEILVIRAGQQSRFDDWGGWLASPGRTDSGEFLQYLSENYVPFPINPHQERFWLFARKGGRIATQGAYAGH